MEALIQDIENSLHELADENRIAFAKRTYPTKMHVIGVTNPNIKAILNELKKETKTYSIQDKMELIKRLVEKDVFELQQLAFGFLNSQKILHQSLTKDFIESIEKNLDNWVSVDEFSLIVGRAWRENKISTDKIKSYLISNDHWQRRIAVVSTVALNLKSRGGNGDTIRTLEICQMAVDDHHDMIVKALSWALRELSKFDREAVIEFIDKYESRMHKKVLREVSNKLETGLKN